MKARFVPTTPAGSPLFDLEARTERGAWLKLMAAASHMPYRNQAEFEARGYTVAELVPVETRKETR